MRIEIASGMRQHKRVMPVLVNNAKHLRDTDLPDELKPLAARHAARLSHERFRTDVTNLIGSVRRVLEEADQGRLAEAKAALTAAPPELRAGEVRTYKRAYICYASADRDAVLRRVQVLKATGIDFHMDLLTREPGERWSTGISDRIRTADLFLLFWSRAAAHSDWVMREVKVALDAQQRSPQRTTRYRPRCPRNTGSAAAGFPPPFAFLRSAPLLGRRREVEVAGSP